MKTDDRARYKNIGDKGDAILTEKTVSIAGIGSVGATMAIMLAREHINLRMVDMGRVEEDDMHRLSIFYEEDITKFKVKQAKARINAVNPLVQVKSFHEEITPNNVFLLKENLIVDASNSHAVNELTMKHATSKKIPFILIRYSGDTAKILVLQKKAPAKILDKLNVKGIEAEGVFGPVTTIAGGLAVSQIIQTLLGDRTSKLLEVNAWTGKIKTTKL